MATQAFVGTNAMAGYYPATQTVWMSWNSWYTTANTATTVNYYPQGETWQAWNQQVYYSQGNIPEPSKKQQEEMAAALKRAEDARVKAKELLLEHLSPVQRESFEKTGLFIVETAKKNRYRLGHVPVKLREDGKVVTSYCIHMGGNVPKDDELLGFKLMLEANEEEFLKTANATAVAA